MDLGNGRRHSNLAATEAETPQGTVKPILIMSCVPALHCHPYRTVMRTLKTSSVSDIMYLLSLIPAGFDLIQQEDHDNIVKCLRPSPEAIMSQLEVVLKVQLSSPRLYVLSPLCHCTLAAL